MRTHSVSSKGLRGRKFLHRFLYAQMALRSGAMIALGKEDALVKFTVEADPPSIYLVFKVRDVDGLRREANLPPGLGLTPIRCLADDEPQHLLTLNVYRVSGITNGMRAEWSVYIDDPARPGTPRYMVVDARSSTRSMDPVDVLTPASTVKYVPGNIVIGDAPDAFTVQFDPAETGPRVASAPEWNSANDYIYWGNGICDRTFYDGGLAAANQESLDVSNISISDHTRWAKFVDPAPHQVLIFRNPIEFVVAPWSNLNDLA